MIGKNGREIKERRTKKRRSYLYTSLIYIIYFKRFVFRHFEEIMKNKMPQGVALQSRLFLPRRAHPTLCNSLDRVGSIENQLFTIYSSLFYFNNYN